MHPSNQSREILEILMTLTRQGWTVRELAFNEVKGSPLWVVVGRKKRTKIQKVSRSRLEAWKLALQHIETF